MNLSFETPGSAYHYTVAVSNDPMTNDNYKEYIIVDNSNGSTDSALAFENVKGRYVRVTFTEATNNEWAVLREVSGTGNTHNLALNKPVSASSVNTGKTGLKKQNMLLMEMLLHIGVVLVEKELKDIGFKLI